MADFAIWATACEGALWPAGSFERAYAANRADANETVIEADSVALAVRSLITRRASWIGTATALLAALTAETAVEAAVRTKTWPATARALSGRLRRAAPNLRRVGISIVFGHRQARERRVEITAANGGIFASFASSPPSGGRINGLGDDGRVTQNGTDAATVIRNPRTSAADDANDANDAKIPTEEGGGAGEAATWTL
jgi:hypothetical protein